MTTPRAIVWLNLSLLLLFPVSWVAPLLRAGLLPLFGLSDISVVSGVAGLWGTSPFLALLVVLLAMVAPLLKTVGLAAIHRGRITTRTLPLLAWVGKLAMADVFLLALYVVIIKGMGVGRVETGWGIYLFTACVAASILVSATTKGARGHA